MVPNRARKTLAVSQISLAILALAAAICMPLRVKAQAAPGYSAKKQQAMGLYQQNRFVEAVPLLEQLAATNNRDKDVFSTLGFCLYALIQTNPNDQERKELAARARKALARAKELGDETVLTDSILNKLSEGTPQPPRFSSNADADKAMQDAEAFFVKGDLEAAVDLYKKALAADPKLYDAALYIGDAYYKIPGKMDQAPEWFAKAIAIDPDRETAYRYWADVLMRQGRSEDARDKFVEAYISDPSNRLTVAAFTNWGKNQHVALTHPAIEVRSKVATDAKGNTNITLDEGLLKDKSAGAAAWLMYGLTRSLWAGKKFSEEYPAEKTYRHSLKEEAEALRAVIAGVDEKAQKSKDLDPSLATLIRLDQAGLLESYILLARSDNGIAKDYPQYLKDHRDNLRRYTQEWVIQDQPDKK